MSLLIVNARAPNVPDQRFLPLAERVTDLVRRARIAQLPIAHVHQGVRWAATTLQVPIGRYDPVFNAIDLWHEVPSGLIEFLVDSPSKTINLAGVIREAQLERLCSLLTESGFQPRLQQAALMSLDDQAVA